MKAQPNRKLYIESLRRMTPEQRLAKAFELSEFAKQLIRDGIADANPDLDAVDVEKLAVARWTKCHNRNY